MDIWTEVVGAAILALTLVGGLCLGIAVFFKETGAILRPYVMVVYTIITILGLIAGNWWFVGIGASIVLINLVILLSDQNQEKDKSDKDSKEDPIVLQITAVAVDEPRVQTKNVTCPQCGGPLDINGNYCAYCRVPLA